MTILLTLIGFTFIIFVHELGHFLVARWAGVRVEVFSIGIGPRLFTLYRDKSGTEYIFSLLPLGGYVKMHGQQDLPTANTRSLADNDSYQSKSTGKRMAIILAGVVMNIIFAYFFIVAAFTLGVPFSTNKVGDVLPGFPAEKVGIRSGDTITSVNGRDVETFEEVFVGVALADNSTPLSLTIERDGVSRPLSLVWSSSLDTSDDNDTGIKQIGVTPFPSATVGKVEVDSPAWNAGFRRGMQITAARHGDTQANRGNTDKPWLNETYYTANGIARLIAKNPEQPLRFTVLDDGIEKVITATTTSEARMLPGFMRSAKILTIENYPAYKAGLRDGDAIVALNNKPVRGFEDIVNKVSQLPKNKNTAIAITVLRDQQQLDFQLVPQWSVAREGYYLGVTPQVNADQGIEVSWIDPAMLAQVPGLRVGDKLVEYTAGEDEATVSILREGNPISFSYAFSSFPEENIGKLMPIASGEKVIGYDFKQSLQKAFPQALQELREVYFFISRLVSGKMSAKNAAGPIAIFETSSIIFNEKGFAYFLLLFAKISISLAVTNLLPIPMLDGGHAVFILYEMIRGKPAPESLVYTLHLLGFALLIFLIIFVNYNDISRILNR